MYCAKEVLHFPMYKLIHFSVLKKHVIPHKGNDVLKEAVWIL